MINIKVNIILASALQEKLMKIISQHQQANNNQKRRLTNQSKSDNNKITYKLIKINYEKC